MTTLEVQTLRVDDCEGEILRAYYVWGRINDPSVVDPPWDEATDDQRLAVARRGYALYDGCPTQPGNQLGPLEAFISIGINSRVLIHDARRILSLTEHARPLLARLADDAQLWSAPDDQLGIVAELIGVLRTARHIDIGKATKVLHKKRPGLIPILDGIVVDFLWKCFPHLLYGQSTVEDDLRVVRGLLRARAGSLTTVQSALRAQGFDLTLARILDFLIWIGWYDVAGRRLTRVWDVGTVAEARATARVSQARDKNLAEELRFA